MQRRTYLYPIKIESCKEGGFLASCSSVQGCYAEGKTIDEAVQNLKEVIKIVLEYKHRNSGKFTDNFIRVNRKQLVGELNLAVIR